MRQPPNPEDLQRVPPESPSCARVRGLLRDYADGDLEPVGVVFVDEHVHGCRTCALELMRAEHEVLRLRRAFAAEQPPALPADFARRVVEQLLRVDDVPAGDSTWPELTTDASADRQPLAALPVLFGVALAMWIAVGLGIALLDGGDDPPLRAARLVLLEADRAFSRDGRRLGAGDGIGEQQWVLVQDGGGARIDWHDPADGQQPAATVHLSGGKLRLENGAPLLMDGRASIETRRDARLTLLDGSELQLGVGEYVIAAESPFDLSGERLLDPAANPLANAPDTLLSVEVVRGDAAHLVAVGFGPTLIAAGQIGLLKSGSPVSVQSARGGIAALDGNNSARSPGEQAPAASILGQVVDRFGQPSSGAEIFVSWASQYETRFGAQVTGADGTFALPLHRGCDSEFAIVMALPAALRNDLGLAAPQAVPLRTVDGVRQIALPLLLGPSAPLLGVVRDDLGQLCVGVRVLPCIVDELFGLVLPLGNFATSTDGTGGFSIERLPFRLPAHQALAVLLWHVALEPTVVAVPVRGHPAVAEQFGPLRARQLRTIRVHQLPPNSTLTVWEEIIGLPAGTAAVRRTMTADGQGRVDFLHVGRGRLWLRSGNHSQPLLRQLAMDEIGGIPRYAPAGAAQPERTLFGQFEHLQGTEVRLCSSYRYQGFNLTPAAASGPGEVRVLDDLGRPVVGAQVFLLQPIGPRGGCVPRLLGLTSGVGALRLPAMEAHDDLVVVGADGSLCVHHDAAPSGIVDIQLQPPGRILVPPALRPPPAEPDRVVTLRLRRFESLQDPYGLPVEAVRFACEASNWEVGEVRPGSYEVVFGDLAPRTVVVPPGGVGIPQ